MSRCIDADALLDEVIERHCKECDKRKGIKNGKYRIIYEIGDAPCRACDLDDFTDELENAPTIEPQRKKGKWIYGESEAGNDGYYCSKCGNFVPWKYDEYDIDFIKEFLFCNKCGAEMRNSVETARDIVHEAINNSVWSDTVDTAKMHKVVDDKYAEMMEGEG